MNAAQLRPEPDLTLPHHDGSALYVSDSSPRVGTSVEVRLLIPRQAADAPAVTGVFVRYAPDAEATYVAAQLERTSDAGEWWAARLPVHNLVTNYRFLIEGGPWGYAWINGSGVHLRDVPDGADFRIVAVRPDSAPPPSWAADAIVYQVFPDRFARAGGASAAPADAPDWAIPMAWDEPVDVTGPQVARQFYGGDLDGVREHLDHIARIADVVYLTPIFPGRSNHRYDASTFSRVDPLLGGDEALVRLVDDAHAAGLKVLGDVTLNHTGVDHEWFLAAVADKDSEEAGYYYLGESGAESPWPARYAEAVAGRDLPPYVGWLGVRSLPKLSYEQPQVWSRIFDDPEGVIRKWLRPPYRLDGWRIDVANMTGRQGSSDRNQEVARRTRAAMIEENPNALLVGEHTHDFSLDAPGDGWHGVMNYAGFIRPVWTWLHEKSSSPKFLGSPMHVPHLGGRAVAETIQEFSALVPWIVLTHSFNLLCSHDTSRIRTLIGSQGPAVSQVAAALLLTMPGIPMITYGDEVGLRGSSGEDGRRPMPWDEAAWDRRIFESYLALVRLRREHVAVRRGGMRWVHVAENCLVFLREHPEETVLVHVARAAHAPVGLPLSHLPQTTRVPLTGAIDEDGSELVLRADGPTVTVIAWAGERVGESTGQSPAATSTMATTAG